MTTLGRQLLDPYRWDTFGFVIVHFAGLAAQVNAIELPAEMGADEAFLGCEREKALPLHMTNLDVTVQPELLPSKELQKQLALPLHSRTTDADSTTKVHLESLMASHPGSWLASASTHTAMQDVFFLIFGDVEAEP